MVTKGGTVMFVDTNNDDDDDNDDDDQTSADRFCPALLRNFRSPSFPSPRFSGVSPKNTDVSDLPDQKKFPRTGQIQKFFKREFHVLTSVI